MSSQDLEPQSVKSEPEEQWENLFEGSLKVSEGSTSVFFKDDIKQSPRSERERDADSPVEGQRNLPNTSNCGITCVWVNVKEADATDNKPQKNVGPSVSPKTIKSEPPSDMEWQDKETDDEKHVLICKYCGYTTVYPFKMHKHLNIDHQIDILAQYVYRCEMNTGPVDTQSEHNDDKCSDKKFKCNICNYETAHKHHYSRHARKHELKQFVYKCEHCPYKSTNKMNFKAHGRKHSSVKKFKCTVCAYSTAYRQHLVRHVRKHGSMKSKAQKPERQYLCDKCSYVTKFEGYMVRHLSKIHNEVIETAYRCDLCDFSALFRWRLNIHKQSSRKTELIKCKACNFETYYSCEYKKHKTAHFNKIYKPRLDEERQNKTNIEQSVKQSASEINIDQIANDQHVINYEFVKETASNINLDEITNDKRKFKCDICGFTSCYQRVLEKHVEKHQTNANGSIYSGINESNIDKEDQIEKIVEEPVKRFNLFQMDDNLKFRCHSCEFVSKYRSVLQKHVQRRHSGSNNRPFSCSNCSFTTRTKDQISLHNKRSLSTTELSCKTCDFRTKYKCQLNMHQKSHYDYKCTICERAYAIKYDLQKHYMEKHSSDSYQCQYCAFQCSSKDSLLSHEVMHTKEKPFKCNICPFSSVKLALLTVHIKKYHSDVRKVTLVDKSKIESLEMPIVKQYECEEFNCEM